MLRRVMTQFYFVARAPGGTSVGGDAFIAGLAGGLASNGHQVAFGPWDAAPDGAAVVIDGLAVPDLDPRAAGLDRAVGLVQHTTALAAVDDKERVRAIECVVLPQLRRVVTSSGAVAERMKTEFGVAADRIAIVTPGAPDVPRAAGSAGAGLGGTCAILSVGALVPRKGHDVLLRALARLQDLQWTLTIAGPADRDPATAAALAEQASQSGIADRVRFAGALADSALADAWSQADFFALATHWEGYGTAVAEALRRGLPVAVTSGGGAAELMSAATGIVSPPGDAEGFSRGLRRLIFDTALRDSIAEASYRTGQALPDWADQARRFADIAGAS